MSESFINEFIWLHKPTEVKKKKKRWEETNHWDVDTRQALNACVAQQCTYNRQEYQTPKYEWIYHRKLSQIVDLRQWK